MGPAPRSRGVSLQVPVHTPGCRSCPRPPGTSARCDAAGGRTRWRPRSAPSCAPPVAVGSTGLLAPLPLAVGSTDCAGVGGTLVGIDTFHLGEHGEHEHAHAVHGALDGVPPQRDEMRSQRRNNATNTSLLQGTAPPLRSVGESASEAGDDNGTRRRANWSKCRCGTAGVRPRPAAGGAGEAGVAEG